MREPGYPGKPRAWRLRRMATGVFTTISRGRWAMPRFRTAACPVTNPRSRVLSALVKPAMRQRSRRPSSPSRSAAALIHDIVPGRSSGPHEWGGCWPLVPPPRPPEEGWPRVVKASMKPG